MALVATAHVMASAPNGLVMETTRAFYNTYYRELVEPAPVICAGHLELPEGPGPGTRLRSQVRERPDAIVQTVE